MRKHQHQHQDAEDFGAEVEALMRKTSAYGRAEMALSRGWERVEVQGRWETRPVDRETARIRLVCARLDLALGA